jgi:hypothetical protein
MRERWQTNGSKTPYRFRPLYGSLAQYGCDPRFESRFHKNCVAYHFRRDLDMTFGFCPAKEKSRESGGSFFYRYLSDRGSARRSYFAECLSAAMRLLMWFASRLSWRWSCLVRWPLSFAMSRFSLVLQALFAALEMSGLSGRQLTVLYSVCDPVLLICFAAVDLVHARMLRIHLIRACTGRVLSLSRSRSGDHQTSYYQGEQRERDFVCHAKLNPRSDV